eukprot:GILI01008714.1.p1 GENE.GILI01008714.1~~GILI01008714.1.p1  ORF type:complete len:213 (-),score=46.94 GILI01008714.1:116-754(-)
MTSIPAESDYGAKEKQGTKLTTEQSEKLIGRLYGREADRIQKKTKEFDDAIEYQSRHNTVDFKQRAKALSPQEEVIVKNCYDNQVALQKKKKEMNEEKVKKDAEVSVKKLPEDERESIVVRLYNQSVEAKKKNLETLQKKAYPTEQPNGKEAAKRDKAGMDAAISHLYNEAIRKKKEADEKLENKYGWKKVKCAKLDDDDLKASASRLSTKN